MILASGEYVLEDELENLLGHPLPGLAQHAFVRRPLVEPLAEEAAQEQAVGEAEFKFGVGDDVFVEADQHSLEEDHRVERRPPEALAVSSRTKSRSTSLASCS